MSAGEVYGVYMSLEPEEFEENIREWGDGPAFSTPTKARDDIHRYLVLLENQANLARAALDRLEEL